MLSNRTKLSLCQYLSEEDFTPLQILLEKHGLLEEFDAAYWTLQNTLAVLRATLLPLAEERTQELLAEVVQTIGGRHPARWRDLLRCLSLDHYRVDRGTIDQGTVVVTIDPQMAGSPALDDDLTTGLNASGLAEAKAIKQSLESSADAFRAVPPDYNACLTHARVALQTLAMAIARRRTATHPGNFDDTSWGAVLQYLRTSGLIDVRHEQLMASVFGFISPGAHVPVGLTQEEMVRLGRSMAVSMCYFLVKHYMGRS